MSLRSARRCLWMAPPLLLLACAPVAVAAELGLPPITDPNAIRAKLAAAGDAEKHKSDTVVVLDHTDVIVRANGIGSARRHLVTKVLKDGGIRSLAAQRFPFDPHTNRMDVAAVRVHRAKGDVIDVPLDRMVRQPQPAGAIYWGTEQYVLAVPRLEVGDAVETLSTMTGFNVAYLADEGTGNPPRGKDGTDIEAGARAELERNAFGEPLEPPVEGHWHDEVHWWMGVPILEKRYTVRVHKDQPLQYEVYSGELRTSVLFDGEHKVYTFEKKDIAPFTNESNMEPQPNVLTKLLLATLPTWEEKSQWLYKVSEPTFALDDAIRLKTREVIGSLRTDEEKWTALNRWVADNIRYAGTSRGMCEGYTNHPVIETFHDRMGVCKDKAGMLVAMLRAAGYESYLVMTMARQRVDRVPADQFNHAVTCVRKPDGSLVLLDPTWMPFSRDNWSLLEPDQHVVYGLPEGKGLSTSPSNSPEQNLASWRGDSQIDASGGLSGGFVFTATGAPETRLRRALGGLRPADRMSLFETSLGRFSASARVEKAGFVDPSDFRVPIEASVEYAAPQFAVGAEKHRVLRLPLMQTMLGDRTLSDVLVPLKEKERKYGLRLWSTRQVVIEETVHLPQDWKVVDSPKPVKIEGPAASLVFDLAVEHGALRYTCELKVHRWTVPPEEFGQFKKVMDKFAELGGRVVKCEVGDGN